MNTNKETENARIMKEEVEEAVRNLKWIKAPEVDNLLAELIKHAALQVVSLQITIRYGKPKNSLTRGPNHF